MVRVIISYYVSHILNPSPPPFPTPIHKLKHTHGIMTIQPKPKYYLKWSNKLGKTLKRGLAEQGCRASREGKRYRKWEVTDPKSGNKCVEKKNILWKPAYQQFAVWEPVVQTNWINAGKLTHNTHTMMAVKFVNFHEQAYIWKYAFMRKHPITSHFNVHVLAW